MRVGAAISAGQQIDAVVNSVNRSPDLLLNWVFGRPLGSNGLRLRADIGTVLVPLRIGLAREVANIGIGDAQGVANDVTSGTLEDIATDGRFLSKAMKGLSVIGLPLEMIETFGWEVGVKVPIECGAQFGSDICGVVSPP